MIVNSTTTGKIDPQEAEVEYSPIKIIILGTLLVIGGLFFGYTLRGFILTPGLYQLLYLSLALIAFSAIFAIEAVLLKSLQIGAVVIFLAVLGFGGFFYKSISLLLALTALAVFLFFLEALGGGQAEIRNVLKIKFLRIIRPVISKSTIALTAFSVVLFMASMNIANVEFTKKAIDLLVKPTEPLVGGLMGFKNFSLDKTLRQLFLESLPQDLSALPDALKNQAVDEAVKQLEQRVTGFTKITLAPTDTIKDVIYNVTFGKLMTLSKTTQTTILVIVGLLLFLLIKSILFIFNFLASVFAFILYELLSLFGFFHIILENRGKEVIVLR